MKIRDRIVVLEKVWHSIDITRNPPSYDRGQSHERGTYGVGEINPRFASRRICSPDLTTDSP